MLASRLRLASGDWGEVSLIQPFGLYTKARARVAASAPAFRKLLKLRILRRNVDFDRHQLIAALSVLGGEPAALEAEHFSRAGALWDCEHHRSFWRWHLHLGAEHRLFESHRQFEPDVVAVAGEETVGRDFDGDDRVAAPRRTFLALPAEADLGPVLQTLRELEVDGLAVGERDPLRLQGDRILERHLEPVSDIGALLRRCGALAEAAERPAALASAG